jgi:putative tryptophan/tyrosine transport system substrate-binding protein
MRLRLQLRLRLTREARDATVRRRPRGGQRSSRSVAFCPLFACFGALGAIECDPEPGGSGPFEERIMKRRDFIVFGGAAIATPFAARAQSSSKPVIGFVNSGDASPLTFSPLKTAFEQGLSAGGFVDGRDVVIEYRWAGGRYERLPELLQDLLRRKAAVIVASGGMISAKHAKDATSTVPILFIAADDPVAHGFVQSLSHPGGNATGVSLNTIDTAQKRLEFLTRLVPNLKTVAALVNPKSTAGVLSKIEIQQVENAAKGFGLRLIPLEAGPDNDIEEAFALAVREGVGGLAVNGDPFFRARAARIVSLAARHRIPTIYPWREYVEEGGLVSYGPTLRWAYRQVADYASRILKGAKPSDLPVQLPSTYEVVINRDTAHALGVSLPRRLFAMSNEYIEEIP